MKTSTKFNPTFTAVGIVFILAIIFTALSNIGQVNNNPPKGRDWQQYPPRATGFFVQQLREPLQTGENMIIEIQYAKGEVEDKSITIYPDEKNKVTFYDDGDKSHGDVKQGDNVYSAFVREDMESFKRQMTLYQDMFEKGDNRLLIFKHRVGTEVERKRPLFNEKAFNSFERVEISPDIFNIPAYGDPMKADKYKAVPVKIKKYTGLIVLPHLPGVLRDNALSDFAPEFLKQGFGPPPPPPPPTKQKCLFITDLSVITNSARTFNPCTNVGNPEGAWTFGTLMKGMANQTTTGVNAKEFVMHWLRRWTVDTTINGEFVKNRSSRMISLVITPWVRKARHNNALSITSANWQTEWMNTNQDSILKYAPFSLKAIVNRLDLRGNFGYGGSTNNSGETRFIFTIIRNTTTSNCRDSVGSGGFDGFNVIFEYGNTQTTCSSIKAFAQQWADLSNFSINSEAYRNALEAITHQVTDSNRKASKPNKNALNQLRTNEIAITNTISSSTDKSPRWQFREFHIMAGNHHLEQVPIHDEPADLFNGADGATVANATIMAGWVNSHAADIIVQNSNSVVPLTVSGTPFQAGKINYQSTSPLVAPGFWDGVGSGAGKITNDSARFFFSLNTCTGCHSAETHTDFTEADYVGIGTAYTSLTGSPAALINGTEHKVDISPFLTGRDAIFNGSGMLVAGDDSVSVAEDATDGTLTGLFFANDAAGRKYPGTTITRKWGFNDLQRRLQDLNNLTGSTCLPSFVFNLANIVFFQPVNMSD